MINKYINKKRIYYVVLTLQLKNEHWKRTIHSKILIAEKQVLKTDNSLNTHDYILVYVYRSSTEKRVLEMDNFLKNIHMHTRVYSLLYLHYECLRVQETGKKQIKNENSRGAKMIKNFYLWKNCKTMYKST